MKNLIFNIDCRHKCWIAEDVRESWRRRWHHSYRSAQLTFTMPLNVFVRPFGMLKINGLSLFQHSKLLVKIFTHTELILGFCHIACDKPLQFDKQQLITTIPLQFFNHLCINITVISSPIISSYFPDNVIGDIIKRLTQVKNYHIFHFPFCPLNQLFCQRRKLGWFVIIWSWQIHISCLLSPYYSPGTFKLIA